MAGMNVVISGDVKGTVTADLSGLTPQEALESVLSANGLASLDKGNTLLIYSGSSSKNQAHDMESFRLSYASSDEVAANLKEVIPSGDVSSNQAANMVIVKGTPVDIIHARKIISELDRPEKQARVEVEVLALNKSCSKDLGIDWNFGSLTGSAGYERDTWTEHVPEIDSNGNPVFDKSGKRKETHIIHDGWKVTVPEGYAGISYGRSVTGHPYTFFFEAKLNALISEGKAKVLAKPDIVTLNGRKAKILIGSQIPVLVDHVENGEKTTTVEYKDAGISLSYTPLISSNNEITAHVEAEVSTPYLVPEMKAYRIVTRKADTHVRLKSGEVVTIGGLIDREEIKAFRKVPVLGDIPILGRLFRTKSTRHEESEIVIALKADVTE